MRNMARCVHTGKVLPVHEQIDPIAGHVLV